MTLPASGALTYANFRDELRTSGAVTFPDATTRWLTERPSGNIILPTHAYSKAAVKVVSSAGFTGHGTTHNFGTMNFGVDFPGRRIHAFFFLMQKDAGLSIPGGQSITNVTIGTGFDPSNGIVFAFPSTAGNTFCGFSGPSLVTSGTSGTVSLNTPFNTSVYAVLVSVANAPTFLTGQTNVSSAGTTSTGVTLTSVAANGLVLAAYINYGDTSGGFTAGVDEFFGGVPLLSYVIRVGFRNRLGATGSYPVSHVSGGAFPCVLSASSFG